MSTATSPVDLLAVQRDDDLLDALGARQVPPVGRHAAADPIAHLLLALAREADREPPTRLASVATLRVPSPARPAAGRRHLARAVTAAVVAAAALSVSGVAAAVTGNPLTPYQRVIDVVRHAEHAVAPPPGQRALRPEARKSRAVRDDRRATAGTATAGTAAVAGPGSRAAALGGGSGWEEWRHARDDHYGRLGDDGPGESRAGWRSWRERRAGSDGGWSWRHHRGRHDDGGDRPAGTDRRDRDGSGDRTGWPNRSGWSPTPRGAGTEDSGTRR